MAFNLCGLKEKKITCTKLNWLKSKRNSTTLVKNGKTDFVWDTAVGERNFSIEHSSTLIMARTGGDLQQMGRMRGSVDGKLLRGTWLYTKVGWWGDWFYIKGEIDFILRVILYWFYIFIFSKWTINIKY